MKLRKQLALMVLIIVLMTCIMAVFSLSTGFAATTGLISKSSISEGTMNLGTGNTGKVIVQFDITPLAEIQDSFIGFCDSSASPKSESDFPVVFKLTADTAYAALNGTEYTSDTINLYAKDTAIHVQMAIDLNSRKYDVNTTLLGLSASPFASGYSFRTGASIDDIGKICLYSSNGTAPADGLFKINNLAVMPYTQPYGQWRSTSNANSKVTGHSLGSNNTGVVTSEFDFTALVDEIGFNNIAYYDTDAKPAGYGDLPIIINITEDGFWAARNGSGYSRIADIKPQNGIKNHLKTVIDLVNQKYDVYVDNVQIAKDFAFRTNAQPIDDIGNITLFGYSLAVKCVADGTFAIDNHKVNGVLTIPAATPTPAPTAAPVQAPAAAPTPAPASTDNPKTSDTSVIYYVILAVSAGAAGSLTIFRKRK